MTHLVSEIVIYRIVPIALAVPESQRATSNWSLQSLTSQTPSLISGQGASASNTCTLLSLLAVRANVVGLRVGLRCRPGESSRPPNPLPPHLSSDTIIPAYLVLHRILSHWTYHWLC